MGDRAFLVVEDNAAVSRALARILRARGEPFVADSVQAAVELLACRDSWAAFFIDIGLPDGSGLDVLVRARSWHPITPAMVLTGRVEHDLVNRVSDLGARLFLKPLESQRIERFLDEHVGSFVPRVEASVRCYGARYGLSAAQMDVLRRATLGESRAEIAGARGTSEKTVKLQAATILRSTGAPSLHVLVERLLRDIAGT